MSNFRYTFNGKGYESQQEAIKDVIATFPETFGMRAYRGEVFRLSETSSYCNETEVMLYTQIQKGEKWLDFCKGTENELRREIMPVGSLRAELD